MHADNIQQELLTFSRGWGLIDKDVAFEVVGESESEWEELWKKQKKAN